MNIYEKLQKCRVDLQKLDLKKSGKNDFQKCEYFELADFLPTVNEFFCKEKLHSKFDIENETAVLTIINSENPDETETFRSPIAEANLKGCSPIQSLGGVHTYMKRYLYMNALEISDGDIIDGAPKSEPLSAEILAECEALSIDLKNVAAYLKKSVADLSEEDVKACVERKKKVLAK